jgi:hypothetical protein
VTVEVSYLQVREEATKAIARDLVRDRAGVEDRALVDGVRAWLEDGFDDRLGDCDPDAVAEATPTDPATVDAPGADPLVGDTPTDQHRLHAYRAVRADLLAALRDRRGRVRRSNAVHDALERLVGARGGPSDRSPDAVVAELAAFVEGERGEAAADRVREAVTPVEVLRVGAILDGETLSMVEAWLRTEYPLTYRAPTANEKTN